MNFIQPVSGERIHIGFFGLRNAGKSSLVNAITGQNLSLVSDVKGTTTDPVKKAMELLPLGPIVIIDTPGIDDTGNLGIQRVEKAKQTILKTDIAILVCDATLPLSKSELELINIFKEKNIPYIIAFNKSDLIKKIPDEFENKIYVSAKNGFNITRLKEKMAEFLKKTENNKKILSDIVSKNNTVILVTPIDESAPKGRLILPQQQTIRELLEIGATTLICTHTELKNTLNSLKGLPDLVITDSQVFEPVSKTLDKNIPLTSFSILFARYKGNLATVVSGAAQLDNIKDGDKILISEGCTHHRQCNDIGTVKLPNLIKNYTKKHIEFEFSSGNDFPKDLNKYSLVVHCGGCMLTPRDMQSRLEAVKSANVPVTNYGILIAKITGILNRSIEPFKELKNLF